MIVLGSVKTHANMIFSPSPQRTLDIPRVAPNPKMLPVMVCVVEVGTPMWAAIVSTMAALVSAAKPSGGCTDPTNTNFGRITLQTAAVNRFLQFQLRIQF